MEQPRTVRTSHASGKALAVCCASFKSVNEKYPSCHFPRSRHAPHGGELEGATEKYFYFS